MLLLDAWKSIRLRAFVLWIIWLTLGTIIYSIPDELGWSKGFYMAVNVGYSIGWGYPLEKSYGVMWYSVVHVLIGASFVAASLGYFARNMIAVSKEWYVTALDEEGVNKEAQSWISKVKHWASLNINSLRIIGLWLLWIGMMIIFALTHIKEWVFIDALYFAVASLSTGGLWAIPNDSPNWYFGVVGVFSATGVPLMAAAMSSLASMFISMEDPAKAQKVINAKVTQQELDMMIRFDIDNGDGEISRAEYILLCAVRLGALNAEMVRVINNRFNVLDHDKSGALSYTELLENPAYYEVAQMRRRQIIMQPNAEEFAAILRKTFKEKQGVDLDELVCAPKEDDDNSSSSSSSRAEDRGFSFGNNKVLPLTVATAPENADVHPAVKEV